MATREEEEEGNYRAEGERGAIKLFTDEVLINV